jgi:hypothetical protein
MIEPETRVDHLIAAAIAKWGTAAVLEQVFTHVTFSARYGPPSLFEKTMAAGQHLMDALKIVTQLEEEESQDEKKKG